MLKRITAYFLFYIYTISTLGLLCTQFGIYTYGLMCYIENQPTTYYSKLTLYTIFICTSLLSLCVTLLALIPIHNTFKKTIQSLLASAKPITISPKNNLRLHILGTIVGFLLFSFCCIITHGYANGTIPTPKAGNNQSALFGLFIFTLCFTVFFCIIGIRDIYRIAKKNNEPELLEKKK